MLKCGVMYVVSHLKFLKKTLLSLTGQNAGSAKQDISARKEHMTIRRRKIQCDRCGFVASILTELETGDTTKDRCPDCMASYPRVLPPSFGTKYRGRGFTKSNAAPRVR